MKQTTLTKRKRGRPPKTDGSQLETRERLVRCGTEILTEKGLANTGIDEILKNVGIPKGSFYHYFSSKDEFGLAVIQNYGTYFANKLDHWLLNTDRAPLDRLQDFIEDAKEGMKRHEFRRGCLIGNLGQELGSLNEKFRAPLEEVFLDWQNRVALCLEKARECGDLKPDADCKNIAAFFWIGWEGAILRAKLAQSNQPIDLFSANFFKGL
ncbi:MAG: TetR/AcrR family transcriptional regulator [Sneathiella sp.]|nr:TetR/AcrR family transcriptional regulator [Sneathiella sp.]